MVSKLKGRPKKYPDRDAEKEQRDLIKRAAELFGDPYDDRFLRDPDAPSILQVAREMGTTSLRVRKMLITAGLYSTDLSRRVQALKEKGASCESIMQELNISRASVNGYLPFEKSIYKLPEPTLYSEQSTRYRKRRDAVRKLRESLDTAGEFDRLWEAITEFEEYPFRTVGRSGKKGISFQYKISRLKSGKLGNELIISTKEKTVTKATVELAHRKAKEVQEAEGFVSGPKKIGGFGSSYLYPVFVKLGVITGKANS